jgi:hypothetical protein
MDGKIGEFNICDYVTDSWDHMLNPNVPQTPEPPRP